MQIEYENFWCGKWKTELYYKIGPMNGEFNSSINMPLTLFYNSFKS